MRSFQQRLHLLFMGVGQKIPDGVKSFCPWHRRAERSAAASGGDFCARICCPSAFVKMVSPGIQDLEIHESAQIMLAGVVGGLASEITGG